ncbi:MAG: YceI family protein [Hyphomonadaceae bacterium]|nr:YceI family protein [Hyphomonadaceae bacterium]
MRALALLPCVVVLAACAAVAGASDRAPGFVSQPPAAEGSQSPVEVPAGAYRLDRNHGSVHFRIRHMDLAWFTARFDTMDARLTVNPAQPELSQLTASVGAASVNTGVLAANGERRFDATVARALGAETTPQITFASTGIARTGANTARVTGDLTLNGQTHPATLEVTFDGARVDPLRGGAMVLGFSGYGVIDRTQWGVTDWGAFTGAEVQLVIEAELVKE